MTTDRTARTAEQLINAGQRSPVYIAAPYGDPDPQIRAWHAARAACIARIAVLAGHAPIIVHNDIEAGVFGDDGTPADREAGIDCCLAMVRMVARHGGGLFWELSTGTQTPYPALGAHFRAAGPYVDYCYDPDKPARCVTAGMHRERELWLHVLAEELRPARSFSWMQWVWVLSQTPLVHKVGVGDLLATMGKLTDRPVGDAECSQPDVCSPAGGVCDGCRARSRQHLADSYL